MAESSSGQLIVTGQRNVETLIVLQPIAVDTASPDQDGQLVIANGKLIAVLVRIDDPEQENVGSWFLEAGLGRLKYLQPQPFETLDDATRWLRRQMKPSGDA